MHIVFTDLDGTLLDHNTYSYAGSREGIELLMKKRVPLVLVSSKTFTEMKELHAELRLDSPIIFENGGGMAFPDGTGRYNVRIQGPGTGELKKRLPLVAGVIKRIIVPLADLSPEEISARTGLSLKRAGMAMERLSTVPFLLENGEHDKVPLEDVNSLLRIHDIKITKGGRFFHILPLGIDKGIAVSDMIDHYRKIYPGERIISIALGDSENDIAMLRAVDVPVLVRRHDGTAIESGIETVMITSGAGPAGFTEAVKSILQ